MRVSERTVKDKLRVYLSTPYTRAHSRSHSSSLIILIRLRSASDRPTRPYWSRWRFATTTMVSAPGAHPAGLSSSIANGWPASSRITEKESVWPTGADASIPSKRYPSRGKVGSQSKHQKSVRLGEEALRGGEDAEVDEDEDEDEAEDEEATEERPGEPRCAETGRSSRDATRSVLRMVSYMRKTTGSVGCAG